tara:strand:+ start:403 stop:588 length:186 start_codon:yes stop_codon:yes gene_type:complete
MQFTKNTSGGKFAGVVKILKKVILLVFVAFFAIFLVGKINFPAPNKNIEKVIPNENFKAIK